ncbi:hypothetical protein [Nitrosopumilus sp. b2]|uniref:hypothetical protein n=1 Tax=Nitrosopumilus sp. b2 TaxID=2109908 RepID=UPI0015F73BAC|nr:hypothetical protein [Nitrosopumilus sp. b2]KAF6245671.1 hypothetical protein C6989_00575 [Nitrosopumilus sp. b2]
MLEQIQKPITLLALAAVLSFGAIAAISPFIELEQINIQTIAEITYDSLVKKPFYEEFSIQVGGIP